MGYVENGKSTCDTCGTTGTEGKWVGDKFIQGNYLKFMNRVFTYGSEDKMICWECTVKQVKGNIAYGREYGKCRWEHDKKASS